MSVIKQKARDWIERVQLPAPARLAVRQDRSGKLLPDPGAARIVEEGIAWLGCAQDGSKTHDGGVARHFSLLDGWAASYPETTGYIIPTMLEYAVEHQFSEPIERVRRMLDWLVSIQLPEGGFQGGTVGQTPRVPVTFNTGQILIGLCAGAHLDDRYHVAMRKAADWLVENQDEDGCWRRFPTPFANPGVKAYETHVSMALFRAASVTGLEHYADAAVRQLNWALTNQKANGWIANCCLGDASKPLTHTLGYALRGIIEGWLYTYDERFLDVACHTASGMMTALPPDGKLPGRLDANWQAAVDWVCLAGASQIAECWLQLYTATNRPEFRDAATRVNRFVRRTIVTDGPPEIRGGVKGSYPVDGHYGRWQYLNWACKFTIDANRAELALEKRPSVEGMIRAGGVAE